MVAPTVVNNNTTGDSAAGTSHTINLPGSLVSGNLGVLIIGSGANPGTVTATGWTFLAADSGGTSQYLSFGYRTLNGTEGATVTVSTSNSTKCACIAYQISGWSGTPEKATVANGTSTTPDPPAITPSWGTADILVLAAIAVANNASITTAAPTNYTNLQTIGTSGGSTAISAASAERGLTSVSTEDPGTFTLSVSKGWNAQTYAIRAATTSAYTLTAAVASFTLTGKTITQAIARATAFASYVLSGKTTTQAIARATARASFTLTGQIANQLQVRVASVASFTLTGQATTRAIARATAFASYVLNGQAITMNYGRVLAAASASFVLTGIAAALTQSLHFVLDRASFVLTAFSTTRALGFPVASASYALTGAPPLLWIKRFVDLYRKARRRDPTLADLRASAPVLNQERTQASVLQRVRSGALSLTKLRVSGSILSRRRTSDPSLGD